MSKREYLFKIFDDFMNNFYSRDSKVEAIYLITRYPAGKYKSGRECPVLLDPNKQHFYNYINKAFSDDLCVMDYEDRYDLSTGKKNEKYYIKAVKILYKNNISKIIEL